MPYVKQEIADFSALLDAREAVSKTGEDHVVLLRKGAVDCLSLDELMERRFPDLLEALSDYERILDARAAARKHRSGK